MNNPPGQMICKYLTVPITCAFGLLNNVRDTNNTNPRKLRLTGPFFSIGVAIRYYWEQYLAEKIAKTSFHTYMFNLGDQLKAFDRLEEQLRNQSAANELAKAAEVAAALASSGVVRPGHPENLVKTTTKKKSVVRVWTPKHEEIIKVLMAPKCSELETWGGPLTREQYQAEDRTLRMPESVTCYFTFDEYNNQKIADALTRNQTKKKKKPESKLYYIDFRKELEDHEAIKQVPLNHPAFHKYLLQKHNTTKVLVGQGTRTIWYGGPFGNKRATTLCLGSRKSNASQFKLRGPVWCECTPSADLLIKGGVILDTDWAGPIVDPGDQTDKTAGELNSKKSETLIPPIIQLEESDDENSSDSDEPTDTVIPTPKTAPSNPPSSKRKRIQ